MAAKAIQKTEFTRTFSNRELKFDDEKRTVELSFSSEQPVNRGSFIEVLSHDPGNVDLSRLGDNEHPLLFNHDPDRQIGVIENARLDSDKKGRATARFSDSQFADEIWRNVKNGIQRKVSVRYQILDEVRRDENRNGLDTVWFKWLPLEVSIVSIPADASVGVGRNQEVTQTETTRTETVRTTTKEISMPDPITTPAPAAPAAPVASVTEERNTAAANERSRINDILACANHIGSNVPDAGARAQDAIDRGMSVSEFRGLMLSLLPKAQPVQQPKVDVPQRDFKRYSISRLVNGLITGRLDGLEAEVNQELAKECGQARGVWLPHAALLSEAQRNQLFVTAAIGGNVSPTNLLASEYIDALRNRAMVIQMGARVLPGLQGTVLLPRLNTPSAITVKTEGAAYATSTATFGQVTLSPKIAPALVRFSKLLAVQSTPAIETLLRDDLLKQINIYLDNQALNGAGSGGEAAGIKATTGINTWTTLATGTPPTWTNIVDMETQVAIDNADVGSLGYLVNPSMRGLLKALDKGTDTGQFVMQPGPMPGGMDMINGYKAGVTNQVLKGLTSGTRTTNCSSAFFGNWEELIVGLFGGGIDLTVDPYSVPGWVQLHGQQYFDIGVRHPVSFFYTDNFYSGTVFNG